MFALSIALATLLSQVEAPTLDELLEEVELEDRQRIEVILRAADRSVAEILALEEELDRRYAQLRPLSMREAIVLRASAAHTERSSANGWGRALDVRIAFSLDLLLLFELSRDRSLPLPVSETRRRRRCDELGADLSTRVLSAVAQRALSERSVALGCEGSAS
jgi:hypothetical protein